MFRTLAAVLGTLALSATSAAQVTVWVDPALGSDTASGTSANDPFQTMTHALSIPVGADQVMLAPGTYGAASGEVFPIFVEQGTDVRATGGRDATTLQVPSDNYGFLLRRQTSIDGLTVRCDPANSSAIRSASVDYEPHVSTISNCTFDGGSYLMITGSASFSDCVIRNMQSGIAEYRHAFGTQLVRLRDCEITGCGGTAVFFAYSFYYDNFWIDLEIDRCRIVGNSPLVHMTFTGTGISSASVTVRDSLVANNAAGIVGPHGYGLEATVIGSTFVNNGEHGFQGPFLAPTVRSSIVAGHTVSDVVPAAEVSDSLIGDGGGVAGPGVLTGDPKFVDPAGGDWSLRFDSPCLDHGEPGRFAPDLNGAARVVDSDLNLVAAPDMGAIEHLPLRAPKQTVAGAPLPIGVTGPAGGFSTIVMSPGGFASQGLQTSFGRYFLRADTAFRLTPVPTTGGAPTWIDAGGWIDPAMAGTTIGVQALPRSSASPTGGAFTNPVLIELQ